MSRTGWIRLALFAAGTLALVVLAALSVNASPPDWPSRATNWPGVPWVFKTSTGSRVPNTAHVRAYLSAADSSLAQNQTEPTALPDTTGGVVDSTTSRFVFSTLRDATWNVYWLDSPTGVLFLGSAYVLGQREAKASVDDSSCVAGSLTGASFADYTISSAKIDTAAVTDIQLATSAVTNDKIASDAVDSSKVADGTLSMKKLAPGSGGKHVLDDPLITPGLQLSSGGVSHLSTGTETNLRGFYADSNRTEVHGAIPGDALLYRAQGDSAEWWGPDGTRLFRYLHDDLAGDSLLFYVPVRFVTGHK